MLKKIILHAKLVQFDLYELLECVLERRDR